MRWLIIPLVLWSSFLSAQSTDAIEEIARFEKRAFAENSSIGLSRPEFDVVKQIISITVNPKIQYVQGNVATTFSVKQPMPKMVLDFSQRLAVDSIYLGATKIASYQKQGDFLHIDFPSTLSEGSSHIIRIFYLGEPIRDRSFVTDTNRAGNPIMWTLSEPYGAKDWWPCKQDLQDKIDSLELFIKVPKGYHAVGNGVFQGS